MRRLFEQSCNHTQPEIYETQTHPYAHWFGACTAKLAKHIPQIAESVFAFVEPVAYEIS